MSVEHWMTFSTFAEQRYFVYPDTSTYTGAIINGNMAAHAPTGLAAFLLERTAGLSYVIDPLTHAFQHDPVHIQNDEGEPKSSIGKLAGAYGEPIAGLVGRKPLLPGDLSDAGKRKAFVEHCLEFQLCKLADAMAASPAIKYLDKSVDELRPSVLIAPYFFMSETTIDAWLPLALDCVKLSLETRPSQKVYAAVVVSDGVILNPALRQRLIDAFGSSGAAGFFVWVDNLDEHGAGMPELEGLVTLARGLRHTKSKQVVNLHGGYFSVLASGVLGDGALTGVAHGPEFGESRSVVPVGGGIPIARYYLPGLHERIKYRDALQYLIAKNWLTSASEFHENVCMCQECKQTLAGDANNFVKFGAAEVKQVRRRWGMVNIDFPTPETKERCLRHYLNRKKLEYLFSGEALKEAIIEDLRKGRADFVDAIGLEGVAHLDRWAQVLGVRLDKSMTAQS